MNQPPVATTADIASVVKTRILEEFLPGTHPSELKSDTPLVTGGVLDSLATIMLVTFLEDRFHIRFAAHETGVDHLDTIDSISMLVRDKLAAQSNQSSEP